MPRRQILTSSEMESLLALPDDELALIRMHISANRILLLSTHTGNPQTGWALRCSSAI